MAVDPCTVLVAIFIIAGCHNSVAAEKEIVFGAFDLPPYAFVEPNPIGDGLQVDINRVIAVEAVIKYKQRTLR